MNPEEVKRLEELRWMQERNTKKHALEKKLEQILPTGTYTFLSYQDSDNIQLLGHDWPHDKWENQLYFQTPVENKVPIAAIIHRFTEINPKNSSYLFFMHYNFGLVELRNEQLQSHWDEFVDLDGDEIFCYIPERPEFICIEKTEDIIIGKENEGMRWIYEVTFSSMAFKAELQTKGT